MSSILISGTLEPQASLTFLLTRAPLHSTMTHMDTNETELAITCSIHSDMYKDVHGVRPRFTQGWSIEDFNADMDLLQEEINEQLSDELCSGDSYHYNEDEGQWEY